MHTNGCVLIEISMEIGMLKFWLGLLVTALIEETYFNTVVILETFEIWSDCKQVSCAFSHKMHISHPRVMIGPSLVATKPLLNVAT